MYVDIIFKNKVVINIPYNGCHNITMKYILTISLFIVSSFTFIYAEFDTEDHNIFYPNQSMINSSFNDTKTHIKLYTRHQFYNGLKVGDGIISEFDAVSQNYTVFPENAHLQTLHFDFTVSPLNLNKPRY